MRYTDATVSLAYQHLGVTREDVALAPQITPQLRSIVKTIRRAGQQRRTRRLVSTSAAGAVSTSPAVSVVEDTEHTGPNAPGADLLTSWPYYLAAIDDASIRKLCQLRRSTPHPLARLVPIEAFCVAVGVSPLRVIELLVAAVVRQGAQASSIIAAVSHPRVVQKTVEMALTDDGIDDRDTLHRAVSFLPTPKGNTTIINNTPIAHASSSAQAAAVAPPPEQTIRRLSDRFNEARLAATPHIAALPAAPADAATDPVPAVPAVPVSRFGDPVPRFAVPSRTDRPTAPASRERTFDLPEEEEDERDG